MTMTPAQLRAAVNANNPGRAWNQLCQAFVWQALHAANGGSPVTYASAKTARLASPIVSKDPMAAPPGAFHYWVIAPYDHVGVSLGNGFVVFATAKGDTVETWGNDLKVSHVSSYTAGTYAGWSNNNGKNGRVDVSAYGAAPAPTGSQRLVRADVASANGRVDASTSAAITGDPIAANVVGNFNGWKHGEAVSQSGTSTDVWFHGAFSDRWFWAGSFTDQGTHDLPDLNPAPPAPAANTRVVLSSALANVRDAANANANKVAEYPAGSTQTFAFFTHGVANKGNDVWFINADKTQYAWSGAFTSTATDGLTEYVAPVSTDPGSVLDTSYKSFTADSPLATWVGSPNYGKRAAAPKDHITLHWMAGTLSGTDATFQQIVQPITNGHSMGTSTNYGVGLTAIHQYIKETEYQHGDGDAGSNASGISIEHEGGYTLADGTLAPVAQSTLDLSAKLVADVAKRLGLGKLVLNGNVFPHKHWVPTTTCPGTLDMQYIVDKANQINGTDDTVVTPPVVVDPPVVTTPPVTTDPPSGSDATPGWFARFIQIIVAALQSFLGGKK